MRLQRAFLIVATLRIALAGYAAWSAVPAQRTVLPLAWSTMPRASITADPKRQELVLELPPVDLPAGYLGPVVLPGSGRLIYWTGRVAIGLRHQAQLNYDAPSQSALWVQDLLLHRKAA